MEETYRSHVIRASAERTPGTDRWTPMARISGEDQEASVLHVVNGIPDLCDCEEEAIFYAAALARKWIDGRQLKEPAEPKPQEVKTEPAVTPVADPEIFPRP
jgi:hypothetical protein